MVVFDLKAENNELCPGEETTVIATTSGSIVSWLVNGKFPDDDQIEGNLLHIRSSGGTVVVSAADKDNSLSISLLWKKVDAAIELEPSPNSVPYLITAEPKMQPSVIIAKAVGIGGSISVLEWEAASAGIGDFSDCPPNGPVDLETVFDFAPTGTGEQITLSFNDVIMGGGIFISVRGIVNGCKVSSFETAGIEGTNPQQSDVQAALPHDTLRQIACQESGQRQFDAPPNGGIDFCPLFGPGGRVGIMQLASPTADEVWNWRANVAKGIKIFNEKVDAARNYPNRVRSSAGFQELVEQFNHKRQQEGLEPIEVVLPDFTTGNFDDDLQQLELDAIRGYNGWNGSDRFGFELHEFRVAVDLIDGEEVLAVANLNEETLQGEAVWERVPVEDRPVGIGSPNYVEEVLGFAFDCSPTPPPTCPKVSITVHPSDTKTHEIPSMLPGFFRTHFVTVKGAGDIVLQATIDPDTPRLRSQLTWEADGAVITSPALGADRLTAQISRNTPTGTKIRVRVKFGNQICQEFLVWIIWCTLAPTMVGTSSLRGTPLGLQGKRNPANDGYRTQARIDWTATIHPAEIIMDIDRPAIEEQVRVAPPGSNDGVAGPGNNDATGSGFSGWDMSRQKRRKVFKGNPDKVPPELVEETTAADPDPFDQPIANYPANDVEGNDDEGATDEDSNPYDHEAGTPGKGTRGTLRSTDGPRIIFMDTDGHSRNLPGEDGDTYRKHIHFREFVRVQLGGAWYRCSEFGLWRWHMNAKRSGGKWDAEPVLIDLDVLDATNDNF